MNFRKFPAVARFFTGLLVAGSLQAQMPDPSEPTAPVAPVAPVAPSTPAPPPAVAPAPATTAEVAEPLSQSIFLDVKDLGTNVSTSTNWQSAWGSYSKEYQKARGLELTLRNPAKIKGEYVVEWYFFAVPVKGTGRQLYDKGSKPLTLLPGGTEKVTVLSAELKSHKTNYSGYYYTNSTFKSGRKPEGWAVIVKIGDKVIRVKTASAQIDAIFSHPDQVQALVDKM